MAKTFIIAGTNSSVGKTTISVGLMRAFVNENFKVNSFKVGPDYIDCAYHSSVHGGQARNLDCWLVGENNIPTVFNKGIQDCDVCIIEGVMGLFDGPKDGSKGSTADIAKLLNLPVILVLDCKSIGQSIAAVAKGYLEFDRHLNIAGFILNKVGSDSHYQLLKHSIEAVTDLPIVGYVKRDQQLSIPERHLGLTPSFEQEQLGSYFDNLALSIKQHIDLDSLLSLATEVKTADHINEGMVKTDVTIGYAFDDAFNFYYQETLETFEELGAKLVEFSPLKDGSLPDNLDGILIGGGFPEMFLTQLANNKSFITSLKSWVDKGIPLYAECGGYMYLCEKILASDGQSYSMVGAIPAVCSMSTKLQSLGYTDSELMFDTVIGSKGTKFRGHEFHYSTVDFCDPKTQNPFLVRKLRSNKTYYDGYATDSLFSSYSHLNLLANREAANVFIEKCRNFGGK